MANLIPGMIRNRKKLIVGIDYGTTFSGISWALSDESDLRDIQTMTTWPGQSTESNGHLPKAPSLYAYAFENEDLDHDVWGYEVEPGMISCSWTKLLLDSSAAPCEYDDPLLAKAASNGLMRLPRGKSAEDVVTDYMKGLYTLFLDRVKSSWDDSVEFDGNNLAIEYWVSVPATWSERAKVATLTAAKKAGFGSRRGDRVNLIAEPEAAAHLALKSSIRIIDNFVEENTGVLVCDCGGGTVDISTYQINQISPTLKMDEACIGVGAKCGGTYIDRNLYRLLSKRFGTAFTSLSSNRIGPGSHFMNQFESKKRDFGVAQASRRSARLMLMMPDLKKENIKPTEYDSRYCEIILSYEDMRSCFEPVTRAILDLVENQTTAVMANGFPQIRTLVLVGGLGSSPYIRAKLEEWCKKRKIRMRTPFQGAWSAVVCGAVLRGLEGSLIKKKFCRMHYGHTLSKKYDADLDFDYDKIKRYTWFDEFDLKTCLTGFMFWPMSKGTIVDSTTEIRSDFVQTFRQGDRMSTYHDLYSCNLDTAPDTIESDFVEIVGTIVGSYADVDLNTLECKIGSDGRRIYRINLTLVIALGAEEGTLRCKLLMNEMGREREIGRACITFSAS